MNKLILPCLLVMFSWPSLRLEGSEGRPEIAGILIRKCLGCHNESEKRGGLDLSSRPGLDQGGDSGPVVEAGKLDESLLWEKVQNDEMPPKKSGALTDQEKEQIQRWIKSGANWSDEEVLSPFELTTESRAGYDWWSLQPVRKPKVPEIEKTTNPIDAFLLEKLQSRGLGFASRATREILIRRLKLDLLGLPPSYQEIEQFKNDPREDAYERLVDQYLASPHYGERYARHWLDVARFGESDGFENDKLRPNAWPYRDYVIQALNDDLPYDRMIREQLAGDVLDEPTKNSIAAVGFLVCGPWDEIQNVGASESERKRAHEEEMEEIVGAVSQTFLGLTVNCARCHDHKFDPIPQADYYKLKAVFDGIRHGERPWASPSQVALVETEQKNLDLALSELQKKNFRPTPAVVEGELGEGKFGTGLDARKGTASAPSQIRYQEPPFSVEAWTRLESSTGFNIIVAHQPKSSAEHWEIYSYAGSGEFSAYLPGFEPAEIKSGVTITDKKWHFVGMSFDGTEIRLSIDGKIVKTAKLTRKRTGREVGRLWIGHYPPDKIGCDGIIDEVRLTSAIQPLDQVPDQPLQSSSETIGLWRFDALMNGEVANVVEPNSEENDGKSLDKEIQVLQAKKQSLTIPKIYSGTAQQPGPVSILLRGDIQKPGAVVTPAALSSIPQLPGDLKIDVNAPESERRRRFADWVASPDNPLTPRVIVNRVWQWHFGQGLITNPSDFGFQSGLPSHPELLDWLAADFIEHGMSLKHLHRRIVLSQAYAQSHNPENDRAFELDADNRLLWRFSPRRLEAESIRDAMLFVSGELNTQVGGESYRPFTVTSLLTQFYHLFDSDKPEFNRRSIYRMQVNTARNAFLDSFDCPSPSLSIPKRMRTTTPSQALGLMNDPFVNRQAKRMAERLTGGDINEKIKQAFEAGLGREPSAEEHEEGRELVEKYGLENLCWAILNSSEFLYIP